MNTFNIRVGLRALVVLGACAPIAAGAFSLNGTKWDMGPNMASGYDTTMPPGTPGSATFSIMASGLGFEGFETHGGQTTTNFGALVGGPTLTEEIALINQAMNAWASVSGFVNLGLVTDGGGNGGAAGSNGSLGDLRFGAVAFPSDSNAIAHAYQPGTEALYGPGGTIAGDLHFNTNFPFVDDANDAQGDFDFDFYTIALHEIGHALGLGHSNVNGSIMEPAYEGGRRSLSADDIAGIQAIYGQPVPEPATLAALALGMGALLRRRRRA